jgi:serine protease AprX
MTHDPDSIVPPDEGQPEPRPERRRARAVPCPLCRREAAARDLIETALRLEPEVTALVAANAPGWQPTHGLCADCARRFASALGYLRSHFPRLLAMGHAILPTAARLGASERFRGRGVTIAFLDSGFYAHPDLVEPKDRIVRYVDVTRAGARRSDLERPDASSWHGMMTSVVACGNGRLSDGLYRGLASEARLVLVKCGSARRIAHDDIRRGLEWVVRQRSRYGIRVVNVSCGGDYEASYLTDGLSQAAEEATRNGILVCAAVGNLGHAPRHPVLPPASAPSVLTVGGLDDKNRLTPAGYDLYHSSYGPTVDGLQKPEVIAPGIWVAAPILPGTTTAAQAALILRLHGAPDGELRPLIASQPAVDPDLDVAAGLDTALLRELIRAKIKGHNLITSSYKHVDGTSFAAPIVASVAAQMFEANPALTPQEAKLILIRTARRVPQAEVDRQGWGVVDPEAAVGAALETRPRPERRRLTRLAEVLLGRSRA